MKYDATVRFCEGTSWVVVFISVAWMAVTTVDVFSVMFTPAPARSVFLDYVPETYLLTKVMNIALPAGILGLGCCIVFGRLRKRRKKGFLLLSILTSLVIASLTVIAWNLMDLLYEDDFSSWADYVWWR